MRGKRRALRARRCVATPLRKMACLESPPLCGHTAEVAARVAFIRRCGRCRPLLRRGRSGRPQCDPTASSVAAAAIRLLRHLPALRRSHRWTRCAGVVRATPVSTSRARSVAAGMLWYSSSLVAHLGTFLRSVSSRTGFFCLALMVLSTLRPSDKPDLTCPSA